MRRALLAILFFVALVAIWAALVHAEIWSPVLLPSPRSVSEYLVNATRDGTLVSASGVTLRRLIVGYFIGLAIGLPLGLLTASLDICRRHGRCPRAWPANIAERLLGSTGVAMVRADRRRHALRRYHGYSLVSRDRDRYRRSHDFTNLCASCQNDGLRPIPSVDSRHFTRIPATFDQRNETRLGICMAVIDGGGNLRDDSDRIRSRPPASLWPRAKCDGSGDRHHVGDRCDWFTCR